jgi:hypothetical protein
MTERPSDRLRQNFPRRCRRRPERFHPSDKDAGRLAEAAAGDIGAMPQAGLAGCELLWRRISDPGALPVEPSGPAVATKNRLDWHDWRSAVSDLQARWMEVVIHGTLPRCTSPAPWRYPPLRRSQRPPTWKLRHFRIGVAAPRRRLRRWRHPRPARQRQVTSARARILTPLGCSRCREIRARHLWTRSKRACERPCHHPRLGTGESLIVVRITTTTQRRSVQK